MARPVQIPWMCVLTVLKNFEKNGMEEIGLVTPTPGVQTLEAKSSALEHG